MEDKRTFGQKMDEFLMKDSTFILLVIGAAAAIFAGTYMYISFGTGAFNDISIVAMLRDGIDTGDYAAAAAFAAGFLIARILEGPLVGLMDIATANNTVAIVMANPIAKEMSGNYGISNKKAASILDTFSCIFQGILPYGAQMLVAISAASGLGETVSAFDILPMLFYPYMLFISSLVFISFEKNA